MFLINLQSKSVIISKLVIGNRLSVRDDVLRNFYIKIDPVFSAHIMQMARINVIIALHIFVDTGFLE